MKYRLEESYDAWGTGNFTIDREITKDISADEATQYMQFLEATGSKKHIAKNGTIWYASQSDSTHVTRYEFWDE